MNKKRKSKKLKLKKNEKSEKIGNSKKVENNTTKKWISKKIYVYIKIAEGRSQVAGAEGAEGGSQGASAEGVEGRSHAAGAEGAEGGIIM